MLVVEIFKAEEIAGQAPCNLENGFKEMPPVCSMRPERKDPGAQRAP
jgi:hypothetical protein